MAEPFLGEIRLFSFSITPKGWHFCDGSILPISQNQELFSILGTTYGGNGTSTFALPDLRGRAPVGFNTKFENVQLGESAGEPTHTLTVPEMPQHNHLAAATSMATSKNAAENVWAATDDTMNFTTQANTTMSNQAVAASGGSQPHSNMQPYAAANFCIAISGIYPSRS
ncbi:phage tail protein [Paenibacillus sp. IB182496]|uniref:Phage tail protein n=1 Tax=Paenibacillus sabuli TaxID=2772509 RepID=A0A927GPU8_9BACL|nr:tail fiber protein [Paenibacillus sabuli]MBD2843601.1 phage tail protein [Paenibacillus sabuli]